jgi:hypothetical protein
MHHAQAEEIGEALTVNYAAVRSWTAKSTPLDVADVLVVPVNDSNQHWLTIAASLERKEIILLDRCAPGCGHLPLHPPPALFLVIVILLRQLSARTSQSL